MYGAFPSSLTLNQSHSHLSKQNIDKAQTPVPTNTYYSTYTSIFHEVTFKLTVSLEVTYLKIIPMVMSAVYCLLFIFIYLSGRAQDYFTHTKAAALRLSKTRQGNLGAAK